MRLCVWLQYYCGVCVVGKSSCGTYGRVMGVGSGGRYGV